MTNGRDYPVLVERLSDEDGGGYLATVPDLPGCMTDGETRDQAVRNIEDAISAWIEEATALGRPIPEPTPTSWPRSDERHSGPKMIDAAD